jgi:hypothetical protein
LRAGTIGASIVQLQDAPRAGRNFGCLLVFGASQFHRTRCYSNIRKVSQNLNSSGRVRRWLKFVLPKSDCQMIVRGSECELTRCQSKLHVLFAGSGNNKVGPTRKLDPIAVYKKNIRRRRRSSANVVTVGNVAGVYRDSTHLQLTESVDSSYA